MASFSLIISCSRETNAALGNLRYTGGIYRR